MIMKISFFKTLAKVMRCEWRTSTMLFVMSCYVVLCYVAICCVNFMLCCVLDAMICIHPVTFDPGMMAYKKNPFL